MSGDRGSLKVTRVLELTQEPCKGTCTPLTIFSGQCDSTTIFGCDIPVVPMSRVLARCSHELSRVSLCAYVFRVECPSVLQLAMRGPLLHGKTQSETYARLRCPMWWQDVQIEHTLSFQVPLGNHLSISGGSSGRETSFDSNAQQARHRTRTWDKEHATTTTDSRYQTWAAGLCVSTMHF